MTTQTTVELCDNELRAFLAEMSRLARAGSVRFAITPRGMRYQVDGADWTPAFGYVAPTGGELAETGR
jgi:hypothetical protein